MDASAAAADAVKPAAAVAGEGIRDEDDVVEEEVKTVEVALGREGASSAAEGAGVAAVEPSSEARAMT